MFNIKDFIEEQSESASDWEIDLSPLLALMVTLIPVLLLQTSFVTLKMLETTLPILSDVKQDKKDNKEDINFELRVFARSENNISIDVSIDEKIVKKIEVKAKEKKYDLDVFREKLVEVKKEYPNEISAKLTPDEKVSYDSIVKLLDVIRENTNGETIKFKNKNGENVETAMLFPNIVFGNIAE